MQYDPFHINKYNINGLHLWMGCWPGQHAGDQKVKRPFHLPSVWCEWHFLFVSQLKEANWPQINNKTEKKVTKKSHLRTITTFYSL